jgi:ABC-type nickel/cobalt efflux system permease component RcnA
VYRTAPRRPPADRLLHGDANDPPRPLARTLGAMRTPTVRRRLLAVLAALAALAVPAAAAAHPLGNFTINHYAALRVGEAAIALDVVVDFAEIPAFQQRIRIDADGDGNVTDAEADAARADECDALLPSLELRVDGVRLDLELEAAGLAFPAGAGGVPTMRVVCELTAALPSPLDPGTVMTFADTSSAERIGWREIVVIADGVTIGSPDDSAPPTSTDASARLTSYPEALLSQPLDVRSTAFTVSPGGRAAAPFVAPDASPLDGTDPGAGGGGPTSTPVTPPPGGGPIATTPPATPDGAAVPGGVGGEIPDLFRVADLTPIVALGSIALAMALGAGHALTPGHGKTLMAAYLVGTRGTIRHAAGLGLAVTVSHTLGILVLALLVTGAESALPADVVVRTVPIVAAAAFVAIGGWMVVAELRRRRRRSHLAAALMRAHDEEHARMHEADHDHDHDRAAADEAHGDREAHGEHADGEHAHGEHSHGAIRHSHLPADDRTISWRSLFALGLAGGIIPSTNALIILLGTIVAGRAAFGIVLVIAFGLGMALVLGGVGAVMVVARERLERLPSSSRFGALAAQAPLVASIAVLGIGIWLTTQTLGGNLVL